MLTEGPPLSEGKRVKRGAQEGGGGRTVVDVDVCCTSRRDAAVVVLGCWGSGVNGIGADSHEGRLT